MIGGNGSAGGNMRFAGLASIHNPRPRRSEKFELRHAETRELIGVQWCWTTATGVYPERPDWLTVPAYRKMAFREGLI